MRGTHEDAIQYGEQWQEQLNSYLVVLELKDKKRNELKKYPQEGIWFFVKGPREGLKFRIAVEKNQLVIFFITSL